MKKLLLIIWLCTLSGCGNPISSAVDKEGEETRQQMQTELAIAKIDLTEEMQKQLDSLFINISGQLVSVLQYIQTPIYPR